MFCYMLPMGPLIRAAAYGLAILPAGLAQSYKIEEELPYYSEEAKTKDAYIRERCVLDLYYPNSRNEFPTIVWFHGGGLKNGNKSIPEGFKEEGFAVAAVNYRLHPRVEAPAYIEDAAAAVAWVFKNIEKRGGSAAKVFVSGSSAGGYLTSMVGLDKRWLRSHSIDANRIAGLMPLAGHTITHFTIRAERGIEGTQPIIDDLAPLYHVRADAPPLLLITGERELEMLGRYEENAYMMRMMLVAGHQQTRLFELDGYGHAPKEPAYPLILKEARRILETMEN